MNRKIVYILTLVLISCSELANDSVSYGDKDNIDSVISETELNPPQIVEPITTTFYDSLETAIVDTSTSKGKREWIMNQFLIEYEPSAPEFDTLFDLNFDGKDDYVIGFYYQSGTGLKHGIDVYFFNHKTGCYYKDPLLSSLANPTFYMKEKKITSFYLPNGAGELIELEWLKGKWTMTKYIEVHNDGLESIWIINYPETGKKEKIKHPYQFIPPQEILKNKYGTD